MPITIPGTENIPDQQKSALFGNIFNPMNPIRAAMRATVSDQDVANQRAQEQAATDRLRGVVGVLQGDLTAATQGPTTQQATLAPQDAAQQKSAEDQATQAQAQQDAATVQARGGGVVPDSSDPAAAISQMNTNISRGVGDASGNVSLPAPSPLTPSQQQSQQLTQTGQQASFDQNKIPVWYKSSSFNMGLISFGLNLLSGNDLGNSFARAGQAFTDMYGQEKRQAYAQELAQQGYSMPEIQEWIQTGNSKALVNPAEKAAKLQQQAAQSRLLNAQAGKAEYESSPAYLAWKAQGDQQDRDLKRQEINARIEGVRQNAQNLGLNAQLGLQRLDLENRKFSQEQKEFEQKMFQSGEKARTAQDDMVTKTQAVAAQRAETIQAGKDLLKSPAMSYTGSNWTKEARRYLSDKIGDSQGVSLEQQMNHYNQKLTNMGNAQLYLEAGGSRIFAKEMENAGKNFIQIHPGMPPDQIRSALENNDRVSSRLDEAARHVAGGQKISEATIASRTSYSGPQYAAAVPARQPDQGGFNPANVKITRTQ